MIRCSTLEIRAQACLCEHTVLHGTCTRWVSVYLEVSCKYDGALQPRALFTRRLCRCTWPAGRMTGGKTGLSAPGRHQRRLDRTRLRQAATSVTVGRVRIITTPAVSTKVCAARVAIRGKPMACACEFQGYAWEFMDCKI